MAGSTCPRRERQARSASASPACTWKRTPARASTTGFADSATRTYLDLNRCGTPLVEIVSEPDIRTPDEAFEYLTRLKEILLYTGVSDCNMEEGSLRCDANVSVMLKGAEKFGTKAEVKNVNSFSSSARRWSTRSSGRSSLSKAAAACVQETRLWNAAEGRTYSMRSKEQAHDYRYFPEPDLPPLHRLAGVS